jgi:hypothetical protein
MIMKKKKHQSICLLCACAQNRTLSAEAAVEIHEFLEVIAENFMATYGHRINRYYAKRAKRNINALEPWRGDCSDDQF